MCHSGEHGYRYHSCHTHDWQNQRHQCCCSGPGFGRRRFHTKKEILTELEGYLEQLRTEIQGVEEHITEIKKG
jgi:hypothetical protein